MTSKEFTDRLLYLATKRLTYYDNTFPGNCGEINPDGSISFDCIGMVKSVINEPYIVYKKAPAGYYVKPGQKIGDFLDEIGILRCCGSVEWGNFSNMINGEYLYMAGHAGIYFSGNSEFNVIECTCDWLGGVKLSWVDHDGTRRARRGGAASRAWEAHGRLTPWINYDQKPEPKKSKFYYKVYIDVLDQWLPVMTNTIPDKSGDNFAGLLGHDIKCIKVQNNIGNVRYSVHTWSGDQHERYPKGKWLKETKNGNGYAGVTFQPADAFILFSEEPAAYRVRLRKTGEWLPWVFTKNSDYLNNETGYAGIIGQPFDAIQIKPV